MQVLMQTSHGFGVPVYFPRTVGPVALNDLTRDISVVDLKTAQSNMMLKNEKKAAPLMDLVTNLGKYRDVTILDCLLMNLSRDSSGFGLMDMATR